MASSSDNIDVNDHAVIAHNLDIALNYISEKVYDVNPKQALCLSNMDYLDKFTLGSINRDINPKWIKEMKTSLLDMHAIERRTTVTVCIDVRDIQIALTDPEAAKDFKAIILDGFFYV